MNLIFLHGLRELGGKNRGATFPTDCRPWSRGTPLSESNQTVNRTPEWRPSGPRLAGELKLSEKTKTQLAAGSHREKPKEFSQFLILIPI